MSDTNHKTEILIFVKDKNGDKLRIGDIIQVIPKNHNGRIWKLSQYEDTPIAIITE